MNTINHEIVEETLAEITASLEDPKGLIAHQRRLVFILSAGSVALLESFLERRQVFKAGAKINHLWLKKKKENCKKLLARQITCPLEKLPELEQFLETAYLLEKDRNEIAYGKRVTEDKIKLLIDLFLRLKKEVEHA